MSEFKYNEEAWEQIFSDYHVLEEINKQGFFKITSEEINKYRQARLMTKFDNSEAIPTILSRNNLSILPISGNSYMISTFKTYHKLEQASENIIRVDFPEYIESIDYNKITSEALALNCTYITKILEDFLEEENLVPTVNGKMGSGDFIFQIGNLKNNENISVEVKNSRIEIDGGYEGMNSLAIIEAKNKISSDFLVRQLYYPYRLWKDKVSKKVRPIFIVYSNSVFTLYEYRFNDDNNYSSIELVKCQEYSIDDTKITFDTIKDIYDNIHEFVDEPKVPFPQADNFNRVINICELVRDNEINKENVRDNYEFVKRQADYYTNAAIYLGFIKRKGDFFELTSAGKEIFDMNYKKRQIEFIRSILSHKVFYEVIKIYFEQSEVPSNKTVVDCMKKCNLYHVGSDETFHRRASTIKSWINWIIDLVREELD